MTKPKPGSQGAADLKANKTFLIVAFVVTALVFMSWFVFDTDQHDFVRRASAAANICGAIMIWGSWAVLLLGVWFEWAANAKWAWLLLLVGGLFTSTGFNLDYFGI